MVGWAIRRLAAVVMVAGVLSAPATAALGQDAPAPPPGLGVKLLEGPADSVDDPRAHEYIIDHLAPGTTISRQVGFSNGDDTPIDLDFYAAAADTTEDGFVVRPGRAASDLAEWTTFDPATATVPPGDTVAVTVTIAVPADASEGERYAAALAERSGVPATNGVVTVSRVGVRIYLSVGAGGEPTTAFTIESLTPSRDDDRRPVVTATVHNTGGRAVDLAGELSLSGGPSSLSAGPYETEATTTLAPGAEGTVVVRLDEGLPDGPWDARLVLSSGLTTATGEGRITFPATAGASVAPTTVAAPPERPFALIAGGAAALALVAALVWWVRRPARHGRAVRIAAAR